MSTSATPPTPPAPPVSATFWERVTGFLHAAGHLVSAAFIKLFGQQAATQFASASLALLKTTVGQIALNAVTEASKAASGAEAQKVAFTNITSEIAKVGLSAKDSEVNMLIELALQAVKGSFGVPAV
jgi:hypothetical protein